MRYVTIHFQFSPGGSWQKFGREKGHRLLSKLVLVLHDCTQSLVFFPILPKVAACSFSDSMKTEKDVEEVNKDKQKTDVCPDTQHPTLTNKQRGNEVTVRPATLDGKQPYTYTLTHKNKIVGPLRMIEASLSSVHPPAGSSG